MTDSKPASDPRSEAGKDGRVEPREETPGSAPKEPSAANKLSPEEQMAQYEEYLKENDWGHQPC